MKSFYSKIELQNLGFKALGDNVLISKKASIYGSENMSIGNNVRIDDFCILSGHIIIGNYVHIAAFSALFAGNAGIILEDFTGLSSRCTLYATSDDYSGNYMTNPCVPENLRNINSGKIIMKTHSIIGASSVVMPNVIIGEGCAVGSMCFISKNTDEWSIYFGIPAKKLKKRSKKILELAKEVK